AAGEEADKAREERSRHVAEIDAARDLADAEKLRRLEQEAPELLRTGGGRKGAVETWLKDAGELAAHYPTHLARLVDIEKSSLPPGSARSQQQKDLQALDDLVARYARVRELLAGASSDEARASLETESADFERQIAVKRAKLKGYDGYVFG